MAIGMTVAGNRGTMINPKTNMASVVSVNRHPTMPMTKRDSLNLSGSRLSLLSDQSGPPRSRDDRMETDQRSSAQTSGRKADKQTDKKVKRTDSYRRATQRMSIYDDLNDIKVVPAPDANSKKSIHESRQKYNTLPYSADSKVLNGRTTAGKSGHTDRKPRSSTAVESGAEFSRTSNLSQRSGTYPSPDTDEDQRSVPPERQKKSAFKKMKERLIITFSRDKRGKTDKRGGSKPALVTNPGGRRIGPQQMAPMKGYGGKRGSADYVVEGGEGRSGVRQQTSQDSTSSDSRKKGFLKTLRNSFRGKSKNRPYPIEEGVQSAGPRQAPVGAETRHDIGPSDTVLQTKRPEPPPPSSVVVADVVAEEDGDGDDEEEVGNSYSNFFEELIDPSVSRHSLRSGDAFIPADRSNLRLEGLRTCRPRSSDRTAGRGDSARPSRARNQARVSSQATRYDMTPPRPYAVHFGAQNHNEYVASAPTNRRPWDLSPDVEMDGPGLGSPDTFGDRQDVGVDQPDAVGDEGDFGSVDDEEQQRRIDEVARCLAAIGDRLVADKESESGGASSSEVEGHRVGDPRRAFDRSIMLELRLFADDYDRNFQSMGRTQLGCVLLPVVKNVLSATTYSSFQHAIQKEVSQTIGWEQVAWYTCVTKAAVDIGGAGKDAGKKIKHWAMKYFNKRFKPFVESQPKGWESVVETASDTELD